MATMPFAHSDFSSAVAASNLQTVDSWWPTENASMTGLQTFKGMLENYSIDQYQMYWQVDGGGLVPMTDSSTDYPHKEAQVDLSGWNWKGSASYKITFVAKDQSGNILGSTSTDIYVGTAPAVVVAPPAQPIIVPIIPIVPPVPVAPPVTIPAPIASTSSIIDVWWPTDASHLQGVTPFKALLESADISGYSMYWQVDGGSQNLMADNTTDSPHKESSVDLAGWNWKGSGPYTITFTAKDSNQNVLSQTSRAIYINGTTSSVPSSSANPLTGMKLFVDSDSSAAQAINQIKSSDPADAALLSKIANNSEAIWLGNWLSDTDTAKLIKTTLTQAASQNTVPIFVAYNIPSRDCGSYSAGGADNPSGYSAWIAMVAQSIGSSKAIVILEPDALAQMGCLSSSGQSDRLSLISNAVTTLKQNAGTSVYIDAGHSGWIDSGVMASRLQSAGISHADGFALNVSDFDSTDVSTTYGEAISSALGGTHFVIDTSRNGNGSNGEWCNPAGRALGIAPTTSTGNNLIDAYLWIKNPGESDGTCNGGPAAGAWWLSYALDLIRNI